MMSLRRRQAAVRGALFQNISSPTLCSIKISQNTPRSMKELPSVKFEKATEHSNQSVNENNQGENTQNDFPHLRTPVTGIPAAERTSSEHTSSSGQISTPDVQPRGVCEALSFSFQKMRIFPLIKKTARKIINTEQSARRVFVPRSQESWHPVTSGPKPSMA